MNYVVAIVLVVVIVVVALALLYPGIKDTARSEAKDEYENTIKRLRKENQNLKWALRHPQIEFTVIGGDPNDNRRENQTEAKGT